MYILNDEQLDEKLYDLELAIKYFNNKARFSKKTADSLRTYLPELAQKYDHNSEIATRSKNRLQIQHDKLKAM